MEHYYTKPISANKYKEISINFDNKILFLKHQVVCFQK